MTFRLTFISRNLPHSTKLLFRSLSSSSGSISLRPYQESCLQACTEAIASGITRVGVSLPTGSGKTTVFASLISRIEPPTEDATKTLIIVNSIELARQAAKQVKAIYPEMSVEIDQGAKHRASGHADVTVATYHTLNRGERIGKFNPDLLKLIIVDEAHHAAAPSYRRILSHFHDEVRNPDVDIPLPNIRHKIVIAGFSATFSRHDGLALGTVFEHIVYHKDFLEMIKEQWLCNVRFTSVRAKLDLSRVKISTATGDFHPTSLAHVVNTETVNQLVVQSWLDRAATRNSTLVFCVSLSHLVALTQAFRQAGIDARYVYSGTPANERKTLVSDFQSGVFPVLLNVAVLTEGADIPNVDCVVVARPTRSRNLFAQMIGRGMRLSPSTGKTDCHIIDFVDTVSRVGGIVSTPTLFGLDPDQIIEDKTLEEIEESHSKGLPGADGEDSAGEPLEVPQPLTVTYVDYDDPFSMVEDTSGAPNLFNLSPFAWVGCGGGVYVLDLMGKGFVRINTEREDDREIYEGYFSMLMEISDPLNLGTNRHFTQKKHILTSETLENAIHGCDIFARRTSRSPESLLRSASWRTTAASDGQKEFLDKFFRKKKDISNDSAKRWAERIRSLTKGEASNLLTRLKHGALSRFDRASRIRAKLTLKDEKERLRKAREIVKVGPLTDHWPEL